MIRRTRNSLLVVTLVFLSPPPGVAENEVPTSTGQRITEVNEVVISNAAHSAAQWLIANRRDDGLFRHGWNAALDVDLDEDNPLRQAGAAAALARAGASLSIEGSQDRAAEVLSRLVETYFVAPTNEADVWKPQTGPEAHPLGLASLIVWGIAELEEPPTSLRNAQSDLVRYILSCQRADGSFRLGESEEESGMESAGEAYYPGEALYALSITTRGNDEDAAWEPVFRGLKHYQSVWRNRQREAFVPWQTLAAANAFLATGNMQWTRYVFSMNDWLLQLQYRPENADRTWVGGFAASDDGSILMIPPGVGTASYAESLAAAWSVALQSGDSARAEKYRGAFERSLAFLTRLQYDAANTRHFQPDYARRLIGAFHLSHQDGTLRIDFTQHALSAMTYYLERARNHPASSQSLKVPPHDG